MNLRKVMEINTIKPKSDSDNNKDNTNNNYNNKKDDNNKKIYNQSNKKDFLQNRKEITVRSDDPRYFD